MIDISFCLIYSDYMPPEYAMREQFFEKLEVFSFGVMVLEIIAEKKNAKFHESHHLVEGLLSYVSAITLQFSPFFNFLDN